MYSLFTTRSSRIRKSRKSDCSSKRTPLEPSVCTQKTTEYKKRDPSLYLQYEGTEAPGFKSGDSIYFQDDRSVQCGTAQLLLADVEEEMSGIYSNYSEQYDASTVHYGTRDPSAHEDYSNMRSRQSYEHFNFPDPNEVMSMMSGFSRGVHDGDTADSQVTYSVKSKKSTKKATEEGRKSKSRKSSNSKKKKKDPEKVTDEHSQHGYYDVRSSSSQRGKSSQIPTEIV